MDWTILLLQQIWILGYTKIWTKKGCLKKTFNAQSKDEIQQYQENKSLKMSDGDIPNLSFCTTLCVNELEKKEDKKSLGW